MTLLQTEGLVKYYRAGGGLFRGSLKVHAVDGVAISIRRGRNPGVGRRERLRQEHPGETAGQAGGPR
jgi:hypothetical protein